MTYISQALLGEAASFSGLSLLSSLNLSTAEEVLRKEAKHLSAWQSDGHAAEMQYMMRPPKLFSELNNFLEGVQSIVSFRIDYAPSELELRASFSAPELHGKVARYAWGRDYHRVIPRLLRRFAEYLEGELGAASEFRYRVFTDAVPLLERGLAAERLGFVGKNSMLISPHGGSYFFLGELLLNIPIEEIVVPPQPKTSCGSCSRCITACPTDAIFSEKQVDANRCISYLTIEKKGALTAWEQRALGEWIFGCDICQEVCPFNRAISGEVRGDLEDLFASPRATGPFLSLEEVFSVVSVEAFREKFAGTPLMRAGRDSLLRNALCVAANRGAFPLVEQIASLAEEDSAELVRQQALASLQHLLSFAEGSDRQRITKVLSGLLV